MKNRFFQALAAATAIVLLAVAPGVGAARTIVDHMDRRVEIPDQVKRIAVTNIYPLASVISVFLGSADRLVGIHPVSMSAAKNGLLGEIYPSVLKASTGFMKGNSLNIEELLVLRPDVVFVNAGDIPTIKLLENAHLPAVAVSTSKWDYDVLRTYDEWIALLSHVFPERASKDVASAFSRDILRRVSERVQGMAPEKRRNILFLFQYDAKRMVTSGRHFFGQYWCDAIGANNVASSIQSNNSNAIINMEQVYAWNPDLIFITNFTPAVPDDLYQSKLNDWSQIKAVKNRQVFKLPLGVYRSYTPSADTPMTLLWMAKTAYPEAFADVDLTQEIQRYYQEIFHIRLSTGQIERMFEAQARRADGFSVRPGAK